ncbi:uncharacterized protein LOC144133624 [Amblyomma americanum]
MAAAATSKSCDDYKVKKFLIQQRSGAKKMTMFQGSLSSEENGRKIITVPTPWDRKSIFTTVAFFICVCLASVTVVAFLRTLESRAVKKPELRRGVPREAIERGCNCVPVGQGSFGAGRWPYYCVCPKERPKAALQRANVTAAKAAIGKGSQGVTAIDDIMVEEPTEEDSMPT